MKKNRLVQCGGLLSFVILLSSNIVAVDYIRDLSQADKAKLLSRDYDSYVAMSPALQNEFITLAEEGEKCPAVQRIKKTIRQGNTLVRYDLLDDALKTVCKKRPNNRYFHQARYDLREGNSRLTSTPQPATREPATRLVCTTFATCPNTVPTFVNDPVRDPAVICDLDVARFVACQALIENLYISGCLTFNYTNELIFTVTEFGLLWDDSCTGMIIGGDPYRFGAAGDIFVDNIYPGTDCRSQLMGRAIPNSTEVQQPLPFIDFCIPFDYSPRNVQLEVDICFLIPCSDTTGDQVRFEVCAEFAALGQEFIDSSNLIQATTNNYTIIAVPCDSAFTYHRVTACIDSNLAQPGDIARLMFRRVAPVVDEHPEPVYVTSVVFRYPARSRDLPVNGGLCP